MKPSEEIIADLKRITLMSEQDIINFVESRPIDYYDLRLFYLREARLPTDDECRGIYQIGVLEFCELRSKFSIQPVSMESLNKSLVKNLNANKTRICLDSDFSFQQKCDW